MFDYTLLLVSVVPGGRFFWLAACVAAFKSRNSLILGALLSGYPLYFAGTTTPRHTHLPGLGGGWGYRSRLPGRGGGRRCPNPTITLPSGKRKPWSRVLTKPYLAETASC